MRLALSWLGRRLARLLTQPRHIHGIGPVPRLDQLLACLQPCDVLLVEGNTRISTAIKYLTQSTWSHAALFTGHCLGAVGCKPDDCFIEADVSAGVRSVGVDEFAGCHVRICRPLGLTEEDRQRVIAFMIQRLGHQYDLRNVFDLARYLVPTPPVPVRFRRRMLSLGSGDPTRAICSTLIAQAFQSIRYPILPDITLRSADRPDFTGCVEEILRLRHHSLFAPRDFDVSPYFALIKPSVASDFDFKRILWE